MIEIGSYIKKCKITRGGAKKFYLLPYVGYSPIEVQSDGMNLIAFPQSDIYVYEVLGSYNQDSEIENGAYFLSQSVNMQLPIVYDIGLDIHTFLKQDYRVIVETNNRQNIMFGVYNGMDATINNISGSDKAEFNGFSLDFKGREEMTGLYIDNLSDFFTIRTSNLLNSTLNFNN